MIHEWTFFFRSINMSCCIVRLRYTDICRYILLSRGKKFLLNIHCSFDAFSIWDSLNAWMCSDVLLFLEKFFNSHWLWSFWKFGENVFLSHFSNFLYYLNLNVVCALHHRTIPSGIMFEIFKVVQKLLFFITFYVWDIAGKVVGMKTIWNR